MNQKIQFGRREIEGERDRGETAREIELELERVCEGGGEIQRESEERSDVHINSYCYHGNQPLVPGDWGNIGHPMIHIAKKGRVHYIYTCSPHTADNHMMSPYENLKNPFSVENPYHWNPSPVLLLLLIILTPPHLFRIGWKRV